MITAEWVEQYCDCENSKWAGQAQAELIRLREALETILNEFPAKPNAIVAGYGEAWTEECYIRRIDPSVIDKARAMLEGTNDC